MIGYIVTPVTPDNNGMEVLDADTAADRASAIDKDRRDLGWFGKTADVQAIDLSSDPRVAKLEEIARSVDRLISNYSYTAAGNFILEAATLLVELDELNAS